MKELHYKNVLAFNGKPVALLPQEVQRLTFILIAHKRLYVSGNLAREYFKGEMMALREKK